MQLYFKSRVSVLLRSLRPMPFLGAIPQCRGTFYECHTYSNGISKDCTIWTITAHKFNKTHDYGSYSSTARFGFCFTTTLGNGKAPTDFCNFSRNIFLPKTAGYYAKRVVYPAVFLYTGSKKKGNRFAERPARCLAASQVQTAPVFSLQQPAATRPQRQPTQKAIMKFSLFPFVKICYYNNSFYRLHQFF